MLILAIDTALGACAACVLDTERGWAIAERSLPMVRGHAEALMPVIGEVMEKAAIDFAQLDRVAVTTGPGSFTGLRVGISAARGIALAASKPVVGVSTLTAYAAEKVSESDRSPIICAIDARHDQVYYQVVSSNGSPLVRPRLAPIERVLEAARFGFPHLVGDAARVLAERWPQEMPPVSVETQSAPPVTWVGWVGAAVDPTSSPARPTYLRAPDAKPQAGAALRRSPA